MAGVFGIFGKIPTKGDFVRANLPEGFQRVWDGWLQEMLVAGKDALGADWDARYMQAPIWRFALPPGIAGVDAVVGVMAPSIDRVARRFPLTFVAPIAAPIHPLFAHHLASELFDTLEEIALVAVADDLPKDQIMDRLDDLSPPVAEAVSPPDQHEGVTRVTTAPQASLAVALAAAWTDAHHPRASLWTARKASSDQFVHFLHSGLPSSAFAPHLFPETAKEAVW